MAMRIVADQVILSVSGSPSAWSPELTLLSNGNLAVGYVVGNGTSAGTSVRVLSGLAAPLTPAIEIYGTDGPAMRFEVVAGADGGFAVFGDYGISFSPASGFSRTYAADGSLTKSVVGQAVIQPNFGIPGSPTYLGAGPEASFVLTSGLGVVKFDSVLNRSVTYNAAGTSGAGRDADITRLSDSALGLSWIKDAATDQILYNVIDFAAGFPPEPTVVTTGVGIENLRIAELSNDSVLFTWSQRSETPGATDSDLYGLIRPASGGTGAKFLIAGGAGDQTWSAPVILPDGGFILAWLDDGLDQAFVQRFNSTGVADGTPVPLWTAGKVDAFKFKGGLDAVLTADGNVAITYTTIGDTSSSAREVRVQIIDFDYDSTQTGDGGDNTLTGTALADTLLGLGGNDILDGLEDGDLLGGGMGDDTVYGRAGNDILVGDEGADLMWGGLGEDQLYGGDEADILRGEEGGDFIRGQNGDDWLIGGAVGDTLWGEQNNDLLEGGDGNDLLLGGDQDDQAYGGDGSDTIQGGNGNDFLRGLGSDDTIDGGAGDDVIYGDGGPDLMTGGSGIDRFVYLAVADSTVNTDRISDFQTGVDKIDLRAISGGVVGSFRTEDRPDGATWVLIDLGHPVFDASDMVIRLLGAAPIAAGDFIWV